MVDNLQDKTVKIFVCTLDKKVIIQNDIFVPLQVGKAASGVDLGYLSDDTGDNISNKNKYYSEQTGVYWVWKNMQDNHPDYVGFCHYRKYPYMNLGMYNPEFTCTDGFYNTTGGINHDILKDVIDNEKIVCINLFGYQNRSLKDFYEEIHNKEDYKILSETIRDKFSDYHYEFERIMNIIPSLFFPYNIYIMKWELFCKYCEFIFPLFAEMENKIDFDSHNGYQSRVFGYMAERLLTVFLVKNVDLKKIIEVPCAIIKGYENPDYSVYDKK